LVIYFSFSFQFCPFGPFTYEFSSFKLMVLFSYDISIFQCLHNNIRFEAWKSIWKRKNWN